LGENLAVVQTASAEQQMTEEFLIAPARRPDGLRYLLRCLEAVRAAADRAAVGLRHHVAVRRKEVFAGETGATAIAAGTSLQSPRLVSPAQWTENP
jgi:hypothetical protein